MNKENISFEEYCEKCITPAIKLTEVQIEYARFIDWCNENDLYPIFIDSRSRGKTIFNKLYKKYKSEKQLDKNKIDVEK